MSHGYAGAMKSAATDADSRFKSLGVVLRSHSTMEQEVLFPALKASAPKLVSKYQLDHERDEATLASLESDVKSAVTRIGRGDVKYPRSEDFKDFVSKLRSFVVGQRVHMNNEDLDLAGALASLSTEAEAEVFAKVYLHLEPSNAAIMPVLLDVLSRQDRAQYVFNVKSVLGVKYPQKWSAFQTILTSSLVAEEMDDLKFRVDLTA
ncbi:hypothetical protein BCR33DRAFT_714186 [Rhizoclosmatium globosum]|uniref:Hemerythrin-like domain-containing protein n=1 Tax=Rhizoclosmatium globosum TaxID=329046 RepID=A0A1Y2CQM4_9FUNG|nr:hypothetical protein BCR33DRAFT_714186 [Rhizoclosmatium globosum]|eukprot:ORY49134.1 hypothetical protein BCR33DRAFT_714186 [Rhizoclosmatium globosum]